MHANSDLPHRTKGKQGDTDEWWAASDGGTSWEAGKRLD